MTDITDLLAFLFILIAVAQMMHVGCNLDSAVFYRTFKFWDLCRIYM